MVDVVDLAVVVRGHVPAIWQRVASAVAAATQQNAHSTCHHPHRLIVGRGRRRWRWREQRQRRLWMSGVSIVAAVAGARVDARAAVREIGTVTVRTACRTDLIEFLWHFGEIPIVAILLTAIPKTNAHLDSRMD